MELYKRTWNSNHYKNEDGTVTGKFKEKWINYMESDDSWQPINPSFEDVGTHFEMSQAPFTAIVPKLSTGIASFISNNRYDIFNKRKIEDEPLVLGTTAQGVSEVEGHIEVGDLGWGETNYVVYEGAYPDLNADLIYVVHNGTGTRLTRLVRFNSNPNVTEDLEISFGLNFSEKVKIKNNGKKWNQEGDLKTKKAISIRPYKLADDSPRGIGLKRFYVWSDYNDRTAIDVDFKKQGTDYVLTKTIPKDYLDSAVYPVYTDDSDSFNPDGHPESTSVDGYAGYAPGDDTWANIRGGAGNSSNDTGTNGHFVTLQAGASDPDWVAQQRGVFLFDASSISGGTVSAADFKINVTAHNQDDFSQSVGLVSSAPNTNTAIINADYATRGLTRYATDLVIADMTDATYNTWTINGTGVIFLQAALDGDGIVKFCTTTSGDIDNAEPTWGSAYDESRATGNFADNGSNEPTLDVTYTPAAGADTGNMFMLF